MVVIHLIYDLTELYPVLQWEYPTFFCLIKEGGGIVFFLISGICATLGHRHLRRGLVVFGCGLLISAAMKLIGAMPIRFGVLHCLGLCMLLWHLFRKLPTKALVAAGIAMVLAGLLLGTVTVSAPWLYPMGLTAPGFESAVYFPLLPFLGYFLLGAALGRWGYPSRQSRFREKTFDKPILHFFCLCGRYSLFIYLIHQPILIFCIEKVLV